MREVDKRMKKIIAIMFLYIMSFNIFSDGVILDPNSPYNTKIDRSSSGVPVINISTPNNSGISINNFLEYNVGKEGQILNNADNLGRSHLGGIINANPNLGPHQAANLIILQVNGANRSQIEGYIEALSRQRVNVILGNENGIYINGGGTVNIKNFIPTTGKINLKDGQFVGIDVEKGQIIVGLNGFDASRTDFVDLISKSVTLQGNVVGNEIRAVTGSNNVDKDGNIQKNGKGTPSSVAIDASSLGGMYANTVKIISTDKGAGVNSDAFIVSANSKLEVTADGKVKVKKVQGKGIEIKGSEYEQTDLSYSEGDINISAGTIKLSGTGTQSTGNINLTGNVENTSALYAKGTLITGMLKNSSDIQTGKNLDIFGDLKNSGHIRSLDNVNILGNLNNKGNIETNSNINVKNTVSSGTISGKNITTGKLDNNGSLNVNGNLITEDILNKGNILVSGIMKSGNVSNEGKVLVNETIQLLNTKTSGILAAGDNIAVKNIENGGEFATKQNIFVEGSFINTGKIEGNDISVKGTSLSNKGSIKGKNIFATVNDTKNEGEIHISENIAFVTKNLTNTKEILAGNDISSNNVNLINTGKIASNGKINFNNSSISNKGEILSNTIEMQDVSKYENTGHIKGDTTTLTTVNDINLTGTLHGENNLTIKGNNIVNIGKTTGIGKISITSNDFTNNSELSSDSITVTASGNVINNSMISGEKGTIKGKELYNNDLIAVNGDLEIEVQNKIVNSAGKVIYAGKSSILKGKEILNNRGDILGGNISLEASKVRNEIGTIQGTGNIDIKSSSFENIGEVTDINRYELYYETWDGKRLSEGELVNWERYDDPGVMKGKHSHNATGPQRQWLENYILNSERITGYKSYLLTSEPDTVSGVIGLQGDYTFASNTARFPVKALEGKLESRANTNYGRVTAGGNITINSSDVVNKDGFISAGNTADIKADRIENTVTTGNSVQLKDGRERIYLRFKRGSKEASANAVFARELVAGGTAYTSGQSSVIEGRSVIVDSTKIIPQSIPQANGEVRTTSSGGSGKAVNVMVNRGITGTNGKIHIVGNTATIADIKNTGTISVNPSFSNSLFIKNVNPSSMYIMETRGRYINLNGYLGSEYFLNKVAYKEDWSRVKRLGDAYYENQIISKALNEKLGTGFINGKSGQELVKNMMDGAETEAKAQGLKVGEALTAEQVKNLKKDIIWYVYTEVNGQKVLTPQVYLSRTTLAGLEEDSRSRIGGSEYTSLKTEDLVNKGMKIGNKGTTIVDVKTLKNETLTNQLSEISGDTTIVKSEGDIRNIGGKISGKDFVGLTSAKGDIVNETTKVTTVRNTGAYDRTKYEEVGSIGEIDGKKVYLSGKDYNSTGAILNTENLVLNLSGDINASSLELEGNDKLGTNSKNYSTFSSKENAGSAIVTKKVSGTVNNINLTGSAFIAEDGKSLSVKNVNVESAVNKYDEYRTASSSNTFTKKNSTMKSHTEENAASTFAIEKNAHISGTVKAIGSNVLLGQDSYVGGKVTTDSRELHNSYYQEDKKSGFSGSIGKGSITAGYGKNRNTYDEKSVINAKSNLQIGDGSVLNKGAEITATNFSHGQISINNGDVVYGARKDTRDVTTTSKSSWIGVSASVKSPALDRVRQAKDTANQIKSGDNIGGAVNIGNIVTGVISGLAGNQGNRQGRYDSRGSVGKEGVKSALANNNFYANIGINVSFNKSKSKTTSHTEEAVVTTIKGIDDNSSITYNNVKNVTYQGTQAKDTTMIYNNVENINKEAVELNNSYSSSGKSMGINAGATVGYGHKPQISGNGGNISFNKSNMNTTETIHHNGSFLNVNEVHNNTKNMKLKGFNQEGGTVTGNIKNLELVSVQNTSTTTGSSSGINVGVSSTGMPNSIGLSGSNTTGSRAFVDNQTTFIVGDGSNLTIGKTTNTGSIIGKEGNSKVKINEYVGKDIENHDTLTTTGGSINLQAGKNPIGGIGINQEKRDKEGISRNTVLGDIEIGNATGAPINRDITKANEITKDTHNSTNINIEGQTIDYLTNPSRLKEDLDKAKQEIKDIGTAIKESINDRGDDNRNFLGQLGEGRLRTTIDNIAGKRLEKATDQTEIGKAFEDAYRDLGYNAKVIYTDPSKAPQLIDENGNIKSGTAYVGKDGVHTIIINTEDPKNSTRSGIIGTISEEGSHIIGKIEGRQRETGTEEKGLESTGRATNEYFTDKYKKNDIPIEAKSDGKDYSNVDFGENVGDDRGACSRGGNILLNCNKSTPAIKPTVGNFRELDDKRIQAKNAITKLKDYCNKNGNVCRYSSEKKEYEFYDTKKLKEYEGYLKLSGLKDTVKIVNKRREYEYAKESQKYKDDRATANKEQIRLGKALARFNYPQLYQTYIFQGGEKEPNAFEASEGFKFRENKFISDIKNSGVEFGGKYELYDGNRYITSLKNYEDLAKFSGVASKNGIKLTMSEIYTSALLTQHDTRPLKIDIKGSAISGEEVTAVAGAVMSRNQLDKMPKYGKPKNKVETERIEQKRNENSDYYNSKSKQLEYGKSIEEKAKDTYHKTPAIFDLEMIKEKPALIRNDGRAEYLKKGYINGKEGIFHITVKNENKVIHKNFVPLNRWNDYMKEKSLPNYDAIK